MGKEKEKLGNPDFWGRFADKLLLRPGLEIRTIDQSHRTDIPKNRIAEN